MNTVSAYLVFVVLLVLGVAFIGCMAGVIFPVMIRAAGRVDDYFTMRRPKIPDFLRIGVWFVICLPFCAVFSTVAFGVFLALRAAVS